MNQLVGVVPGADMASVTVLRDGVPDTLASTSERVWAIDADQYAPGDGPCLEAASTGQFVRVGVEGAARRWPAFARSARDRELSVVPAGRGRGVRGVAEPLQRLALIDQAMGALMAREGIGARQAFDMLARESQHSNVKLHHVAGRIVRDTGRPARGSRAGRMR